GRYRCPRRRPTSRPHLRRFFRLVGLVRLAELNRTALLHVIARIHRELDDHIAVDHGLAAEPGVRPQVPRGVEPVELLVLGFAEILFALAHIEMTGRAGAAAAAG